MCKFSPDRSLLSWGTTENDQHFTKILRPNHMASDTGLVSVSLLKVRDHKRSLHHFLLSTFPHWSSHPVSHVVCSAPSLSPLQLLPVNSAEVLQLPPFVSWHKLSVSSRSDPFVLHYSWSSLSAYSSSRMPSVYPSMQLSMFTSSSRTKPQVTPASSGISPGCCSESAVLPSTTKLTYIPFLPNADAQFLSSPRPFLHFLPQHY